MKEAIGAYRRVTATDEFKEIERLRSRARHSEASALHRARLEGEVKAGKLERAKWRNVAEKKTRLYTP